MKKSEQKVASKHNEPKIKIPKDPKAFEKALKKGWQARERVQEKLRANRSTSSQDLSLLLQ